MGAKRACCIGVDSVMDAHAKKSDDLPYYAVFYNESTKDFQYNGEDYEEGRRRLESALSIGADNGDQALYYLKIYPVSELVYTVKSKEVASIPFRLNEYDYSPSVVVGRRGSVESSEMSELIAELKKIPETLSTWKSEIDERIAALESEEVEDSSMLGKITGIMENPTFAPIVGTMMGLLGNAIAGMVGKFVPPGQMPSLAVNGVKDEAVAVSPDEDVYWAEIETQLYRLRDKCSLETDLKLLADMAETEPAKFNIMLTLLRGK